MVRSVTFYTLLFLSIVTLLNPCVTYLPDISYDPMSGVVTDQSGAPVSHALVLSALTEPGTGGPGPWNHRLDSAWTKSDGTFYLPKGFPNSTNIKMGGEPSGCGSSRSTDPAPEPKQAELDPFLLVIVSPNSDTTIVEFTFVGSPAINSPFGKVDTTIIAPGTSYGKVGGVRTLPPIVLHSH